MKKSCVALALAVTVVGSLVSGCSTIQGGPDRLYSVSEEMSQARSILDDGESSPKLVSRYYGVDLRDITADSQRMALRNEIIARRMYAIDVQYSEYEANLTSERQKFGFAATTAAAGLAVASSLTEPVRSAQLLSGVGAGILGAKGAYDSEVVIAKTLQIVQGYMRAARDTVAARQILPRMDESAVTYPLSAALHDLEDYYRAGTFTAGLIPALKESGIAASAAADEKTIVIQGAYKKDESSRKILDYLKAKGSLSLLNSCMPLISGQKVDVRAIISNTAMASYRDIVIRCALGKGARL